jgi:peptidoglycan/LPS O-acetylase OafA/YrhL
LQFAFDGIWFHIHGRFKQYSCARGKQLGARLHRLDHLRAFAAILVGYWHFQSANPHPLPPEFNALSIFAQGWTGVSFFCVISGFILTRLYVDRQTSYADFIVRRVLRIAPLFLLLILVSFYATGWDAPSILFSIIGLFRGGFPSFVGPAWTVVIEFQFYLVFPFILTFSKRYGIIYLFGLMLVFIMIRASMWGSFDTVEQLSYYTIIGRMDEFLIGMIAAHLLRVPSVGRAIAGPLVATALFAFSILTMVVFFWWFNAEGGLLHFKGEDFPSHAALWIIIPTGVAALYAVILMSYLNLPSIPRLNLISKGLAYIGTVSYSIYLIQMLVFTVYIGAGRALGYLPASWIQGFVCYLLVAVPMLVGFASITYFVIERPFMQLRSRSDPRLAVGFRKASPASEYDPPAPLHQSSIRGNIG